jgi:hypothetical protein
MEASYRAESSEARGEGSADERAKSATPTGPTALTDRRLRLGTA